MITTNTRYVIATKQFPLLFDDGDGNMIDSIDYALLYERRDQAQYRIDKAFDEPENYQVLCIKVTFEF